MLWMVIFIPSRVLVSTCLLDKTRVVDRKEDSEVTFSGENECNIVPVAQVAIQYKYLRYRYLVGGS